MDQTEIDHEFYEIIEFDAELRFMTFLSRMVGIGFMAISCSLAFSFWRVMR